MQKTMTLTTPLTNKDVSNLRVGDIVLLNGTLYTARDAAHKRLIELIKSNQPLPMDIKGHIIYYVGPSPTRPGQVIGAAGPTTAGRMDDYAPILLEKGLKGMIGKGEMGSQVTQALQRYQGVYCAATGGAGAFIAASIIKSEILAYEDLGPEAIRKLVVRNFEVIVAQDCHGGNIFIKGRKKYER